VEVKTLYPASHRVDITAMGTVMPARQINLKSRVAGELISGHPEVIEGGRIKKGETLLQVDPIDYELALEQAKAKLVQAEYAVRLEQGRQIVAQREWTLLNQGRTNADKDLALRVPHLKKVKAELKAAQAELSRAEVNLKRTTITAPFDALILNRRVELGGQVREQDTVAVLVDSSEYLVGVSLPVDRLNWINIPTSHNEPGSPVEIYYGTNSKASLTGNVIRLEGGVETQGRMARLLISIKNPLAVETNGNYPLLIGSYVRTKIQGTELKDVYKIPRAALRGANSIWIVGDEQKLQIKEVNSIWKDQETALVKNDLQPGTQLIISELTMPIEGMPLIMEEPKAK
jgi:RND family efflux transporter MFP subunit